MQFSRIKYTLVLLSKIRDELERRFFLNTHQPIRTDRFTLVVHETPSLAIRLFACTDFMAMMFEQSTMSMTWGNKSVSLLGRSTIYLRMMSTNFSLNVNLHRRDGLQKQIINVFDGIRLLKSSERMLMKNEKPRLRRKLEHWFMQASMVMSVCWNRLKQHTLPYWKACLPRFHVSESPMTRLRRNPDLSWMAQSPTYGNLGCFGDI